ncbi:MULTISPECIES: hypothetical protein [Bdellovibrio]|jgi:hypothetical protein|uniref:Flp2 protein n=1 Tax=Bdellovibrio bacteriovorus TaxID=959 RepID=Q3LFB2_BDEBC|nr:hypothetical protein [Bdellovibrio bacteriovorus]BFD58014.1 hypothetical protein CKG001_01210 [Bdellovibrio sp. CKG001]BFD61441.1 hypothetical protein BdHM001_01220 [Bdellovibrio sp. HM001]BFD65173.1 hypothetical protein HAGR004_01950 [Bdellovibrio sp. HAGR004]UXR65633.1 hypothetical protein EZJ49_05125 [Bdellovibrio bacteriovorus]CAE47786.1 Flp2 protein [Bdellovibrio bacteriovorus]
MTIEYVLLIFATFFFILKGFMTVPAKAFKESGPRLGARVEQQLMTGAGFKPQGGNHIGWVGE